VTEHRAATKGFYDKLQQPEHSEAKALLEGLLDDSTRTYEEICRACKSSGLFEDVKDITPQDLTRYRQRQAREEQRDRVVALMETDAQAIIDGASKNPSGLLAQLLRKQLTEHIVARFDQEMGDIDVVKISKEVGRHALVEQRDRKLGIEEEKAALEKRRIELAERQADLERDRFGIAAKTWQIVLQWMSAEEPTVVDKLIRRSEEVLEVIEECLNSNAA